MPRLSVVIPTYRRPEILRQCLEHLERQTIARDIDVRVVSDGHDANTAALFANRSWHIPVHFTEVPKSQQGAARNHGVSQALSPIVLFIGDDIFLEPDACAIHLRTHIQYSVKDATAVLGHVTWDPDSGITPVMKWLEKSGWQFGYPSIRKYTHAFLPREIQQRFSYTSNISLPTEVAKRFPFRADISLYGWEDIEWGKRLAEEGVRLFYEPDASALHHHRLTLEQSLSRMTQLGRSARDFAAHTSLDVVPRGWKRLAYHIASIFPTMAGKHRKAFLTGIKNSK